MRKTKLWIGAGICLAALAVGQEEEPQGPVVNHSECSLFGPKRESLSASGLAAEARQRYRMSELTSRVVPMLAKSSTAVDARAADSQGLIDSYIFKAIQDAGATPAPRTNDYEFCRRVTFDLVGRPPTAARLV